MISVDAGGYFRPSGPESALVNPLMREALDRFPVLALNLNTDDLKFWPELSGRPLAATRIISSNLVAPPGVSPPLPFLVERVQVGSALVRLGFIGLADPARIPPRSGFSAVDPIEALARLVPELRPQVDFLVLLADLPEPNLELLAQAHPEIFVVVRLERRFQLSTPKQVNNAVILNTVERGRFLGHLALTIDASGAVVSYRPEFVELNGDVPEDEELSRRVRELSARYRSATRP